MEEIFSMSLLMDKAFTHILIMPGGAVFRATIPLGSGTCSFAGTGFFRGKLIPGSAYDMGNEPALQGIEHTADSITIELFANGGDWEDDESWAIDNLEVNVYTAVASELIAAGAVWNSWMMAAIRVANGLVRLR